jgi:quercetin dioxygenase-like cupin family protein
VLREGDRLSLRNRHFSDRLLDAEGFVTGTAVLSGHPLLAKAAQENVAKWRFKQTQTRHHRSSKQLVIYQFVLEGTCKLHQCKSEFVFEYPNVVTVRSGAPLAAY